MTHNVVKQTSTNVIKIRSNWYDVTDFMHVHPGGPKVFMPQLNKDCTHIFNSNHESEVLDLISHLKIDYLPYPIDTKRYQLDSFHIKTDSTNISTNENENENENDNDNETTIQIDQFNKSTPTTNINQNEKSHLKHQDSRRSSNQFQSKDSSDIKNNHFLDNLSMIEKLKLSKINNKAKSKKERKIRQRKRENEMKQLKNLYQNQNKKSSLNNQDARNSLNDMKGDNLLNYLAEGIAWKCSLKFSNNLNCIWDVNVQVSKVLIDLCKLNKDKIKQENKEISRINID